MEICNTQWTRPYGPPIVWRIIEVEEKLSDNTLTNVRLSIQDIPEDRYEDALDHMCEYYLADEALNKCLRIKEDKSGVKDNRLLWKYCLDQGISIGAFKLSSNGKLGELVAVNVLFVINDESLRRIDEIEINLKSSNVKKILGLMDEASSDFDVNEIYGIDEYICEYGLSVKPQFRGKKIAVHLLDVWADIGRRYEIFTAFVWCKGPASRIQAERAGFETILTVKYAEVFDENGQLAFPSVESDAIRLMIKQICMNDKLKIKTINK